MRQAQYTPNSEYKKVTITLKKSTINKYKEFLKSNGMSLSGRLMILIQRDLEENSILIRK